ncbi:NhaC family Na+:H+ antiporter [Sphingomonas naasensis]|nr:Na+/H+ antiporter NhaC family protein [Sphingomonas naasensis]NIJ21769.1 NhaC family Na+:H+ antiporter [Sphingomonas naasensis]
MSEPVRQSPPPIRPPSWFDAIAPLILLAAMIMSSVALFGLDAINGPIQLGLLLAAMVTAFILMKNGHSWEAIAEAGARGVASVVGAIFILFAVGALIGAWNMAGTIPTLVYYGMHVIHPNWFYFAALLVCGIISMGIGSSWTTAGTMGVGLVGLATLVGVSPVITAGAVISGCYVGEKLSPLSETAILSAQLTGTDIYSHLRQQAWSSIPALIFAILMFAMLGLTDGTEGLDKNVITSELSALDRLFWITPFNLLPLLLLVILSLRKTPASIAIMLSALLAAALAPFTQPEAMLRFVAESHVAGPLVFVKAGWLALANGFEANSGIPMVDGLLSRGGMDSMLLTIWLILGALVFGTLLDEFGLLAKLIAPVLLRARSTGSLIATVVGSALGLNLVSGDQYVAVVLPARMFREEFEARGLASTNLSRAVCDAGSVTSPLIPWNSCGAYMAVVLGVPTMLYLPWCFFNLASPLVTLALGYTGFRILRTAPATALSTAAPAPPFSPAPAAPSSTGTAPPAPDR